MRETAVRYYTDTIRQFGATARGVDWNSEESQVLRFAQLLRLSEETAGVSVIDYGCGYGAFVDYLRSIDRQWKYTGFDISESMIDHARAVHGSDPATAFTTDSDALEPADYTIASGLFNVKQDHPASAWQEYALATLDMMNRLSLRGFAFNMLSTYSDPGKRRNDLFYAEPGFFFDHCKRRFAPRVALLHDYPLFEFTILVRK